MLAHSAVDLETIEASIETQIDVVARATSSQRYVEIIRLQMLREMREILAEAYRFSAETAEHYRGLTSESRDKSD